MQRRTRPISGLECAYVVTPGQVEYHGNTMQIIDQVDQDLFISDDPTVFPDAVAVIHVDITINMVTGKATAHSTAVLQPDGGAGTWEGHADFHLSSMEGAQQGHAVFHGTGDLTGQTLIIAPTSGDTGGCPGTPFTAGRFEGFIVPAEP